MKNKTLTCTALIVSLFIGGLTLTGCATDKESRLEAQARITKADAEKTALARVPNGTVKECELEKENGKLVWSFDIATPDSKDITEVQVDAITGKIVSVEKESPADQEKEKQEKDKKG